MPTLEGRVDTPRADRYLAQLCEHLDHLTHRTTADTPTRADGGHHGAPPVTRATRDGRRGDIVLNDATCTLLATDQALLLRLEGCDDHALHRARQQITHRIEIIGRREHLSVTWAT